LRKSDWSELVTDKNGKLNYRDRPVVLTKELDTDQEVEQVELTSDDQKGV